MKTTLKKSALFSATCLAGGAAMLASVPAFAQDAQTSDAEAAPESTIVVTGSLIRNPNLQQANPVNVTSADTIELKQSNTAEQVLREIPGVVANIGSSVNNGNGGASYVDLRGLGSIRNIVLLDGNRIAPADLEGRVDLNNVPLALISRVDALTGAAVTTYGADAITGVVNFITKKDFAGIDLSLGNQITEKGDGNYFRADLTVGANFDDGRGNAVLSVGYQESDPVYQGDRDFSQFSISSFSGTFGGSGTSFPSRIAGTRPLAGGVPNTQTAFVDSGTTAPNPNFNPAMPASATNPATLPVFNPVTTGAANGGLRQLNTAGQAVGTFAFFNFNPFNVFQTPFKRYNIFAQANYEASDAVEVYTRGLFSKNTVSTIIAPSGSFGGTVPINLNNPFLPATVRNQICAFNVAPAVTGLNSTLTGAAAVTSQQVAYIPRFTPAECAAAATAAPGSAAYRVTGVPVADTNGDGVINAADNPAVTLNRRALENGPRISEYNTTIFDYRIGARGGITETVDWDLSASYGESDKVETIQNYTLQSRFRQGALVNGTAANPVCQDPSNGCVPINIFDANTGYSAAAADFLSENSTSRISTSLAQVRGVVSGDLGFKLSEDAEPIGFAVGAEYRRYTAQQAADTLAKTPGELGGAGGADPDIDGGYDVYEGYGELIVPVFDMLTLEGGARYSHYKVDGGPTNNTFTYKGAVTFQPIPDIKFRANYAHAVRAPNISELFTPQTVGLTTLQIDPCAGTAPAGNANLRAVCLAQGAPATTIGSITNPTAAQANTLTGGNINLDPEKADTYTVGVVLQPEFLPRFSLSVDYYNIKVEDVIGAATTGDVIAACFGSETAPFNPPASAATSPACTAIQRNPITGGLDGDPAITQGLFQPLTNLGRLETDGIDVIANYQRDFGKVGWSANFVGNYTFHQKFKASPTAINRDCVGLYSANCGFTGSIQPEFQWSLRNTFTIDDIDLSVLWRHIDGVEYEDAPNAFSGTLPTTGGNAFLRGRNINANRIPSYDYFDATLRFNVNENMTFTFTVQNLFDKAPPIVGQTIGTTSYNSGNTYPSTYDALGRRYGVGARIRF